jgi:hypothetical protein
VVRKLGLIFLGSVISFLLANQIGSAIRPEEIATCYPSEFLEKEKRLSRAWIAIEYKDSYLKIRAFCFNNTSEDEVLRYKLEAKKNGKSGTAHTCQSGSVCIPSQEKKCLSRLNLGISPKDCYRIKLEVYKDGKLVAEDSVFYPQIPEACNPSRIASPFPLAKTT